MTEREQNHIINRYLDGELTASEQDQVRRLSEESRDFSNALNAAVAIRDAARRLPSSTTPPPEVESRLFQALFVSEEEAENESESKSALPLLSRISGSIRRRGSAVVAATLAIAMVLGGVESLNEVESEEGRMAPVASSVVADHAVPDQSAVVSSEVEKQSSSVPREDVPDAREFTVAPFASLSEPESPDGAEPPANEGVASHSPSDQSQDLASLVVPPNVVFDVPVNIDVNLEDGSEGASRDRTQVENGPKQHISSFTQPDDNSDEAFLAAAYRHGVSAVANTGSHIISTQEMSVRIEGHFADRHSVSLSVGQRGLVRNRMTYTVVSSTSDPKKGGPTTSSLLSENTTELAPELWAGIGYDYSIARIGSLEFGAGAHIGVGERSIRYGVEVPATLHVTENVSAEVAPFVARSAPYNQSVHTATSLDDPHQFGEEITPAAITFGAHVGLSVKLNP